MVQIFDTGKINEIVKFLVICWNFPYQIFIANVASVTVSSILFVKFFSYVHTRAVMKIKY